MGGPSRRARSLSHGRRCRRHPQVAGRLPGAQEYQCHVHVPCMYLGPMGTPASWPLLLLPGAHRIWKFLFFSQQHKVEWKAAHLCECLAQVCRGARQPTLRLRRNQVVRTHDSSAPHWCMNWVPPLQLRIEAPLSCDSPVQLLPRTALGCSCCCCHLQGRCHGSLVVRCACHCRVLCPRLQDPGIPFPDALTTSIAAEIEPDGCAAMSCTRGRRYRR